MPTESFHLKSADNTNALAAKLATLLHAGDVVALYGELGTGKTTIARQIIRQLVGTGEDGREINVTSPSFNLLQKYVYDQQKPHSLSQKQITDSTDFDLIQFVRSDKNKKYTGSIEIFHFDLYRLNHPDEIFELGIEEAWDKNISIIEWPEIIEHLLPSNTIKVKLSTLEDDTRECLIYT